MKASEALEVVAYWEAMFRQTVPDEAKPLWISKLAVLERDEATAAIDRMALTRDWAPNVLQIVADARRGEMMNAYEAWKHVTSEIKRVGTWGQPAFADSLITRAVDVIGWNAICNSSDEDTFMLEQFRRVYDSLLDSQNRRALAGYVEIGPSGDGENLKELVDRVLVDPGDTDRDE